MKRALFISLLCFSLFFRLSYAEQDPASFAYVLQADAFAKSKRQAVKLFAACGRDWIILDTAFDAETLWSRADLERIRRGQSGRKVLAYISIGEAEDYRAYWREEWGGRGTLTAAAPAWLGPENPEWEGNYRVKYWDAEWQRLILAVVDDAMNRGFDGVYLDIVDAFETFERDGAYYIENRVNPDTNQSYRRDMVDWVMTIAVHARARNPAALVIPQNGSQLLEHADFRSAISAIGIEDLFTNGDNIQPTSHTREVLRHLKKLIKAKKPVLLIEYPKNAKLRRLSKKLAMQKGMTWLITDRQLKTLGESGSPNR